MSDDRERLRAGFDVAAERYHAARPDYPDWLEVRRRLGGRPSVRVRRRWGAVLHVATRSGPS